MKLYDYLKNVSESEEITVWDKEYDMETYFYGGKPKQKWDTSMCNLSKLLTVTEIKKNGITVNFSEVIENKISELEEAGLFNNCDIESIMEEIEDIMAGYVSERWMEKFVEVLSK